MIAISFQRARLSIATSSRRTIITLLLPDFLLKPLAGCPYSEQLSVVLERAYQLGQFERLAFCNGGRRFGWADSGAACRARMRAGDSARSTACRPACPQEFILVSGGILPQVFLNVPLTTTLLTNGAFTSFPAVVCHAARDIRT